MEKHAQARQIVETLQQAGFTAYYAGGWVRDYLLQHPSDDIDIATNASPEDVQRLFPHTVPIGIAFGIILVIIDEHQYEVATFRQDIDYQDGRRPTSIAFTSAQEDAKRRDFTINGMFFDPIRLEVLDYVGGRSDLEAKLIRAIGNAHERIKEDRLRMIRGIRLACRFQFQIEKKTQEAIRAHAKELFPAVAIERVVQELEKGHLFGNLQKMLVMLHEYGLLSSIFPELSDINESELKRRLHPTHRYPHETPLIAFLLPMFSFSLEEQINLAKKLKLSNTDIQFLRALHHAQSLICDDLSHLRIIENVEWVHLYANDLFPIIFRILSAHVDLSEEADFIKAHENRKKSLSFAIDRIRQRSPVVASQDLIRAGIQPGKQMGILLKEAERIACQEFLENPDVVIDKLKKSPVWHHTGF